ncbi:prepilin-type N-terminal cleavage/methylation domain-containing protein [Undibacterium flavidum]|uniref:Prepilin-type N-terminal cleavage/methylation domain-containing protein n=1 Tax=Undibacterium flavidum TaxID=2762297 RepID=A0ABR6YFG1_9BURK|nr:prepilin-type N-terminal cleavage/methylation domain-containing protein [Undibacterium flavidum]MBC3875276.1 prepilin-type N-terminal cleavage/methylation domain-containing protein [Undibacterium flavidum]
MKRHDFISQRGFTLIEAIIVILLTGVLAAIAAKFISRPIEQYLELNRRADLTEIANSAVRRMSRDLHLALSNGVRQAGPTCVEFLMTTEGGRYRAGTPGNIMQFDSTSGTQFDVIGPLSSAPVTGDFIVVYNLGIPGADAFEASYRGIVDGTGTSVNSIKLSTPIQNPIESPAKRFFVLSGASPAVTFNCQGAGVDANGNGTGRLYRLSNYAIAGAQASCPTLPANTTTPLLAENVASCSFAYTSGVIERSAVLSIRLGLRKAGESVTLYQDVNINNVP